jgi:hypothetical protein
MLTLKASFVGIAILTLCIPAMAGLSTDDSNQNLAQIEAIWAKLPKKERTQFLKRVTHTVSAAKTSKPHDVKEVGSTGTVAPASKSVALNNADPAKTRGTGAPAGGCTGFEPPLLRKSWTDIDLGACPQLVNNATGAVFSYSDDEIKHNNVWTAQGTAALIYTQQPDANSFLSSGVYGTMDRVTNSALSLNGSNIDTDGFGGFVQYGRITDGQVYSANYFRLRAGVIEDNIKNTTNADIIAEWIPVFYDPDTRLSIHHPITIPGTEALIRFDPEIMAQYVEATGKNQLTAFNSRSQALLIGPELTVRLYPGTSAFWHQFTAPTVSYWWAYDTYSAHAISWLDTSVGYNLTQNGNVALTLSYERGHDADTAGTLMNLYLISLSAKL